MAAIVLAGSGWVGWQVWRNSSTIADPQPDWPNRFADVRDRLDPNQEPAERLAVLPGIGPAKAQAIVRHRELHGPFFTPDDLTAVYGIGDATVRKLLPYLIFPDPENPMTRPAGD